MLGTKAKIMTWKGSQPFFFMEASLGSKGKEEEEEQEKEEEESKEKRRRQRKKIFISPYGKKTISLLYD